LTYINCSAAMSLLLNGTICQVPRRRLNTPTSRDGHSGNGQPSYAAPIINVAVAQKTWLPGGSRSHGLHRVLTIFAGGLCAFVWIAIVIFRR
jgi:hypothetical protein